MNAVTPVPRCPASRLIPALLLVCALILPLALVGQARAAKRLAPPTRDAMAGPERSLELTAGWAANAEVQGSGAEVSASGAKLKAAMGDFSLSYEWVGYSWSNVDRLPFGNGRDDPWDNLSVLGLGYSHHGAINPRWRYFFGAGLNSSFESKICSDSLSLRGFGGVTWIYSRKLQFNFGAGGVWHKVRSQGLPVVGVIYNQGAAEGFSVALGFPMTYLAYHFNKNWAVKSRVVEFDLDVFRLDDDSPAEPEGFLERRDLMADLGLEWTPAANLVLYVGARYYFKRELTLYDLDGDNERTFDVDDAWGGVFRVTWKF